MLRIEEFAKTGELFDGRYKLLRTLSTEGGSADVWLAIDQNTIDEPLDDDERKDSGKGGIQVAIKIYRPKNALDIEGERKFREEYKIVYNCHHANLLQPTNFSIFKETPYLVLPFCQKGSSELMIGKELSEEELWKYVHDVASGLAYLHSNTPPIIHQDIKPANVLIDENNNYAITDFGISAQSGGKHEYYGDDNSGTFAYMAPERFVEDPEPMAASDIWAFGATLYELITGHAPFGDEGGSVQPDGPVSLAYPSKGVPSSVKKMIAVCLNKDPDKRPTAKIIEESARQRNFPPSKTSLWKIFSFVFIVALAVVVTFFFIGKKDEIIQNQTTPEEAFNANKHLLESENADSLRLGLARMDSLADANYIPAMYQIAYTYGWYSDSASISRKKILGIKTRKEKDYKNLPCDSKYNDKAISLFDRIILSDNPKFPRETADAMYRKAGYTLQYLNKEAEKRAKALLQKSKGLADNDSILLYRINESLKTFEN